MRPYNRFLINKHAFHSSKQQNLFKWNKQSGPAETTKIWVCSLVYQSFFWDKIWSLLKERDKKWVCSCTPYTPGSAYPALYFGKKHLCNRIGSQNDHQIAISTKIVWIQGNLCKYLFYLRYCITLTLHSAVQCFKILP